MSEEFLCCGFTVPKISMIAGGILTAWGIVAYIISDMASITSMIPTFMGAPILLMGVLTERMPEKRKLFMHISSAFGLLSALGGLRLPMILMDDGSSNLLIASHAILLIVGGVYTTICVKSFIAARKSAE